MDFDDLDDLLVDKSDNPTNKKSKPISFLTMKKGNSDVKAASNLGHSFGFNSNSNPNQDLDKISEDNSQNNNLNTVNSFKSESNENADNHGIITSTGRRNRDKRPVKKFIT